MIGLGVCRLWSISEQQSLTRRGLNKLLSLLVAEICPWYSVERGEH